MIASYFYRASKISLQLITEDMRDRIAHMQENPGSYHEAVHSTSIL